MKTKLEGFKEAMEGLMGKIKTQREYELLDYIIQRPDEVVETIEAMRKNHKVKRVGRIIIDIKVEGAE